MKKSSFKRHTQEYIKGCRMIVKNGGRCSGVDCSTKCPFVDSNVIDKEGCTLNRYSYSHLDYLGLFDDKLLNSALDYLGLFNKKPRIYARPTLVSNRRIIMKYQN